MKRIGILTAGGDTPALIGKTVGWTTHRGTPHPGPLPFRRGEGESSAAYSCCACYGLLCNATIAGAVVRAKPALQYNADKGFHVEGYDANRFRDRWGLIHARQLHPALYDAKLLKPSRLGIEYLLPIFTGAIGSDDAEHMRRTLFDPGNLGQPYYSINTDVNKRIRFLETEAA